VLHRFFQQTLQEALDNSLPSPTSAPRLQASTCPIQGTHLTPACGLAHQVQQRWAIENSWHWVRDVSLREEAHRYREGNGVQILATPRSLAINALRLDGIWSITEGIAALAHSIKGLLRQGSLEVNIAGPNGLARLALFS